MAYDIPLRVNEVLWIHKKIVYTYDLRHTGLAHPRAEMILSEILRDASSSSDPYEQSAIVLERLITAHVFEDGNKRTAWLAAARILSEHDEWPSPDRSEAAKILRHIAKYNTDELETWLRSGEIDRSKLRS